MRNTPYGWTVPRAAVQRRWHVTLRTGTCGDTLPARTSGLGCRDTALCLPVVLCHVRVDLGHWTPVHRCACSACWVVCAISSATWLLYTGSARSVRCGACAVSWATWLLFTVVPARCVVLRVRCPGPHGSCSPVCSPGALWYVCGVLGHLAPVQHCAGSAWCGACAASWAIGS